LAVAGDDVFLSETIEPRPLSWRPIYTGGRLLSGPEFGTVFLTRRPLGGGFELELAGPDANQGSASRPGVWLDGKEIIPLSPELTGLEELGRLEGCVSGGHIVLTGVGRQAGSDPSTQKSSTDYQQQGMWVFDMEGKLLAESQVPAVQTVTDGGGDHTAFGPDGSLYLLDTSNEGLQVRRYSLLTHNRR
jgi:hypothetical protein